MADLLTNEQFKTLKNYCKIDQDFDDDVLKQLIDSAALAITRAINSDKKPSDYIIDSRFFVALMAYVEEDYYYRGTGSEVMRFPLQNTNVVNTINQLRSELPDGSDDQ
ncbi:head-tail connector protein [Companilactobacillus mishanensis]|uniref:Phage gp6-like head-tail connector protein n=1 Tax=Companilactobacillus mishanensis TaxID=2486008 RepID=A0A5P0ZGM7_9LACO|nr:head-tail connector protein [Companilactobacillus mishanensis]MQS52168.1 phage gp6-like head-tail connector protein [Companilactobacillus mishanensis]